MGCTPRRARFDDECDSGIPRLGDTNVGNDGVEEHNARENSMLPKRESTDDLEARMATGLCPRSFRASSSLNLIPTPALQILQPIQKSHSYLPQPPSHPVSSSLAPSTSSLFYTPRFWSSSSSGLEVFAQRAKLEGQGNGHMGSTVHDGCLGSTVGDGYLGSTRGDGRLGRTFRTPRWSYAGGGLGHASHLSLPRFSAPCIYRKDPGPLIPPDHPTP